MNYLYSDSEEGIFFFLFNQALMNTYELAHEFYEAQLHSDNGIPYQNALTEERDTDARIVSHYRPWCSSLGCKNKNCYRSFDPHIIIDHRSTMRETKCYLTGKIDQCYIKSTNKCKNNASERQKFKYSFLDILAAVCEDAAFIFIHDIGNKAFKNLKQHYNRIEPRRK